MPYPTLQEIATTKKMYTFTLSLATQNQVSQYLQDLRDGKEKPGAHLSKLLEDEGTHLDLIDVPNFVRLLLNTKQPKNFAEEEIHKATAPSNHEQLGYNLSELTILANIGTVINSYVFNDGGHGLGFQSYKTPLPCVMGFVSAPLLEGEASPDRLAVLAADGKSIDQDRYFALLEDRLLPILSKMSAEAVERKETLALTVPGLGCGMFAGEYTDTIRGNLFHFMQCFLKKHVDNLPGISSVYLDVFESKGLPKDYEGHHCVQGAKHQLQFDCVASRGTVLPRQLVLPVEAKENARLATLVAADLLSWMGNDGWVDSRSTDEGVKGMSSFVMAQIAMTMCPEVYNIEDFEYQPLRGKVVCKKGSWRDTSDTLNEGRKYAHESHADLFVLAVFEPQIQFANSDANVPPQASVPCNSPSDNCNLSVYPRSLVLQTKELSEYIKRRYPKQEHGVNELEKMVDKLTNTLNKEDAKKCVQAIQLKMNSLQNDFRNHRNPVIDRVMRTIRVLLSQLAVFFGLKSKTDHARLVQFSHFTRREALSYRMEQSIAAIQNQLSQ